MSATVLRVVIAPDSFKGTVGAAEAAAAIAAGWRSVRSGDELVLRPMADGGEGTIDAVAAAVPGSERVPVTVHGPDSRLHETCWLRVPGGTALVELAATSGLTLLDELAPLDAHTTGFGEAIADALDHGADRVLLAIGGSSSTDGGAGMLAALGAGLFDAQGRPVRSGNRGLGELARMDRSTLRPPPPGGAIVLSDVVNPLLGELGAAAVFGPQKGASPEQVEAMDVNLGRLASLFAGGRLVDPVPDPAAPGTGAAGGTGFGLLVWGAELTSGAAAVAETIGLPAAVTGADLVITGEGRYDGQSEAGKAPTEVARIAASAGAPVALVAGAITTEPRGFAASVSLTELAGDGAAAMAEPVRYLEEAGARLARAAA